MQDRVARATLGRLPDYLQFVRSVDTATISSTKIAMALGLGEVQVRKDLAAVCGSGRPKVGYETATLIRDLEEILGVRNCAGAVIVGAGRLGTALLEYRGFEEYGIQIKAAFDRDPAACSTAPEGRAILPMEQCADFCRDNGITLAIITAPADAAQEICDLLVDAGIRGILNFAPCRLSVPDSVTVRQENLALSLAHLNILACERD